MKQGNSDDFQTPPIALNPLLPYLKKEWLIWECAEGRGNLTKALKQKGFNVIGTDILQGYDFLNWFPEKFDCIITNPPYSLKQKFIERCYKLNKPFALLLPLTALETLKRQSLFKKWGLELILFDKRINFETPSGKGSGSWFASAWFTNWLNIGRQLTFVKLEEVINQKLELRKR
jgi:hypothetical protein